MSPLTLPAPAPAGRAAATGSVLRVAGPVVTVAGLTDARLFDLVRIGPLGIPGEIIRLDRDRAVAQAFEDTSGLGVGDPVRTTGAPLQAQLGPGLLGAIVDGTQRPLPLLAATTPYVPRGVDPPRLDRDRRWLFTPSVTVGDGVGPGDVLGSVPEGALDHRVLVPPGIGGTVEWLTSGELGVDDVVAVVAGAPVRLSQHWPVRTPRPVATFRPVDVPLLTGQRVLDMFVPLARGGTAVLPGGFGTGKTMLEQALAKFAAADVVVYIGCGERGNELAEVLEEFPTLSDPRTGAPLMQRTVLVANTSNMPVAAREASVYTGMTIAEYYRDQGYHVLLLADSTSRWGEALREVSSRLEEIPAEDGYPAYLAARLAGFYERAGEATCLGREARIGSVSVVGAVSPAGGDFSEPVTQNSLRLAGAFWALDASLARRRHFPAVDWIRSYSGYRLDEHFARSVDPQWPALRAWALELLATEATLAEVVQLLGLEALAPEQRLVVRTGRMLRESFLQQSSFDPQDASCPPRKQMEMLRVLRATHDALLAAVRAGADVDQLAAAAVLAELPRMRSWPSDEAPARAAALAARIAQEVQSS